MTKGCAIAVDGFFFAHRKGGSTMDTVAYRFIDVLASRGVRYGFGIPGGPWIPYMDAMNRRGIAFVLTANEASGGFMADVTARLTGVPAICHGTFGPGATNLATGVCSALLDRSPMIAVTTEQSQSMAERTTQMGIDHQALFSPIAKETARLSVSTVAETASRAMTVAMSELPGPVHIGHPVDIADSPADGDPPPSTLPPTLIPDVDTLNALSACIETARRPLIAAGLTAARFKLGEPLRRVAERFGAPVVLTPMAKGLIGEDHPLYAGVLFHAQSERLAPVIRQSDLVIGIGYDPVEFNYEAWLPDVALVHVDSRPADVDDSIRLSAQCLGDLETSLRFLANGPRRSADWDPTMLADHRRHLFDALRRSHSDFGPAAALDILRDFMPEDGVMTCDVGAHTHLIGQLWRTPAPGLQIMTNGGSSMGFGIPAALAAALCQPERCTVCVTGDGGFLMMAGELITARRLGLPVIVVVLADRSLSLIEVKQGWRGVDTASSFMYKGDFLAADRLFGVPVFKADRPESLRKALALAREIRGPAVVEASIDGGDYHHLISRSYK
ncbi:MAG: thiamine pyrophosphate-binding protein [Desulfobacterales bacterium]|jgi:acetolactate synthase-1/2/3 large subunit